MRTVFLGTPAFAVPSLEALLASRHTVVLVVTQPDRPGGRGMRLQPPPVKEAARRAGLPVFQPERVRDPGAVQRIRTAGPDVLVVVAFGQLVPKALLDLPPRGCVNLHPSLLPRHRGAAPVAAALLAGDRETGVTTMYLDEGLDTGDIILQRATPIGPEEDRPALEARLARLGAELLVETLDRIEAGNAPRIPQDEARATYTPRLTRSDGEVVWDEPADLLQNRVRALNPWPGAFTWWQGKRVRICRARVAAGGGDDHDAPGHTPGEVLATGPEGIRVATGQGGSLLLLALQPEGKRPMTAREFVNGYRVVPGARFGPPGLAPAR